MAQMANLTETFRAIQNTFELAESKHYPTHGDDLDISDLGIELDGEELSGHIIRTGDIAEHREFEVSCEAGELDFYVNMTPTDVIEFHFRGRGEVGADDRTESDAVLLASRICRLVQDKLSRLS